MTQRTLSAGTTTSFPTVIQAQLRKALLHKQQESRFKVIP
jgi:hypothetical protein